MNDLLTDEDYFQILQTKLQRKDVAFISAELNSLDGEGFMGDHYFLKINYKLNNQEEEQSDRFFVKTKPTKTEVQKTITANYMIYEKEIFFYDYLFKEFQKMGYPSNFFPKCYLCKNDTTIVLEDLQSRDFEIYNRKEFFNLEHCRMALKVLANYHANCYSYEEKQSQELGRTYKLIDGREELFKDVFYNINDNISESARYLEATKNCFIELTKIMPVTEEWRVSFEKRIKQFEVSNVFWQELPYRKTSCHGDLWSNNLMFRYKNGILKECCLLDFQMIRYHHPAFDVYLIIYSNTGREFRIKYMNDLLDYYYESFDDILKQNGFKGENILPKEHFLKAAEALKKVALFQGAGGRTLTQLPKEILNDAINSEGHGLEDLYFEDKRTKLILEGCKKDERFKKIIFDDIYDLNDCL